MTRLKSADVFAYSTNLKVFAIVSLVIGALLVTSTARAVVVVDMDFNGVTGLENAGAGPDGTLKMGASIGATAGLGGSGGLVTDGSNAEEPDGAGMDLALGALNPFGGDSNFSLSFDFATTDDFAVLFSSDGSHITDPDFEGQEGSINIGLDGGFIFADFWFIDGVDANEGTWNDGAFHTLLLEYDATTTVASLSVDGGIPGELTINENPEFPDGFSRDATTDLTRLGDENNFDAGVDWNDGCDCTFDNLLIEAIVPPFSLTVDRDTGNATLTNISGGDISFKSYDMSSGAGTIDPAMWDSIDGRDSAGDMTVDPANDWTADSSTDMLLSEGITTGTALTLADAATIDFGNIWKRSPFQDLDVDGVDGMDADFNVAVNYVGDEIVFGDLNLDTLVNVADYLLFVAGFDEDLTGLSEVDAYFLADLNGDEVHNFEDFIAFVEAFDEANGGGAFSVMLSGVPEPSTWALVALGAIGLWFSRARLRCAAMARASVLVVAVVLLSGSTASAAQLVEYLFDTNFNDTSGNNRHGIPDPNGFSLPTVSSGKLQLTGNIAESLIVPLGAANPFGGLSDYTVEMTFNSVGSTFQTDPPAGMILFSSADPIEPDGEDGQSLSIFIEPQEEILDEMGMGTGEFEGGALVADYFFLGEVRVPDALLLDGVDHTIQVTYRAPDEPGDPEDPNPGQMFINIDGAWLAGGEIAPRQPDASDDVVRIGSTINLDFPFECEEGGFPCFTLEMEGTVDDFSVTDEEILPTLLRAEVDLTTGDISLMGGEFPRDIRYYEILSEADSLNAPGWNSLESQGADEISVNDGDHWDELVSSSSQLAESFLFGSSFFDENRTIGLGSAFSPGGAQDLEFTVVTTDLEDIPLEVLYVNAPPSVPGDYNQNGVVDAADYTVWRDRLGQPIALPNTDPTDVDDMVTQDEYTFWKNNFGNTSGSGSVAAGAVPEPGTGLLAIVGLLLTGAMGIWPRRRVSAGRN